MLVAFCPETVSINSPKTVPNRQQWEKAHLLLDVLSCPYIPSKFRKQWIKAIARNIHVTPPKNDTEANIIIDHMTENTWQINWSEIDLLNSLEKKELKRAY